jgi:hypothetical protein
MLVRLVGCLSGREMKTISALFTNISLLAVVLQIFFCESCIIFFKMPLGESRWSKKGNSMVIYRIEVP